MMVFVGVQSFILYFAKGIKECDW